jgi:hypothetical protein
MIGFIDHSFTITSNQSKLQSSDIISVYSDLNYDWLHSQSQSQSYVTTDRQSASLSRCQAPICGLWPDFYYCQRVEALLMWALSRTRERTCRLQLLLALASAVFLGSDSRGTRDHIYSLRFESSPTWRNGSSYLYPPGTRWSNYTPRHWVPFLSPPKTGRATVKVFNPASTRARLHSDITNKSASKNLMWKYVRNKI